jgi:hypothetical protein
VQLDELGEVLFRGGSLRDRWGFYMAGRPDVPFSGEASVALESLSGPDGGLWGASIEIGAVALRFSFVVPGGDERLDLKHHPEGIFIRSEGIDVQRVLVLGWVAAGTDPVILTRIGDGTTETRPSAL